MKTARVSSRPLSTSLARLSTKAAVFAALAMATSANAQSLTWDPLLDGGVTGGAGTWDLTLENWFDGLDDVAWPNLATSEAIFGGTGGAVTINTGTGVAANKLSFNVTGYTIGSNVAADVLTLAGTAPSIAVTTGTATINSVIEGAAGLTKTGTGTLVLGGTNTFGGGLNVTGGTVSFSAEAQLGTAAPITLNGGTLSYTGTTQIVSVNAARVLTIGASGGELNIVNALTGPTQAKTQFAGTNQITGTGTFTKSGAGLLTITSASNTTFTGDWVINGGIVEAGAGLNNRPIAINGIGTPTQVSATIGELALTSNVSSNITLAGGIISAMGATRTVSGTVNVTANSGVRLQDFWQNASGGRNLTISGNLSGAGNLTTFNGAAPGVAGTAQTGGILILAGNNTGYTGNITVGTGTLVQANGAQALAGNETITLNGGTLNLFSDGNGSGSPEAIDFTDPITVAASSGIAVGRLGTTFAPLFATASNKTIRQNGVLTIGNQTLTVTNSNGYGLDFAAAPTFTAAPTFSVVNATNSNVVQGLTISGDIDGSFGFTKAGAGTLALTNTGNGFTGNVSVTQGVLSISDDAQLGVAGNKVLLNPSAGTSTLRATDSFSLAHAIQLTTASNTRAIEVVTGETLTLTSALDVTAPTATLHKNDNGTLALSVANPVTWTGGVVINAGAVLVSNPSAFGATTATISVSPGAAVTGAALQLSGGISLPNPVNLQGNNNVAFGGINFGGQIQSVSGANTAAGQLRMDFDAAIGADSGATLNVDGGIHNPTTSGRALHFTGGGTINVNSNITSTTATANQYFAMRKYGSGTLNFTVPISLIPTDTAGGLQFFGGTTSLKNTATLAGGATIVGRLLPGATVTFDNSTGTPVGNRFGSRPVQLTAGNINLIGGSTAVTETLGALTLERGHSTFTVTGGTGGANLIFGAPTRNSFGTALFRGTDLGQTAAAGVATIASTTTGFTFVGATGAAGSPSKGILPWALVDSTTNGGGTSFATADTGTSILRALAGTEVSSSVIAGNNISLTSVEPVAANTSINSLTLGNGGGLTIGASNTLTVTSGGVLGLSGNSGISGGTLTQGTGELIIHTVGNLDIASTIVGGAGGSGVGLTKSGAGTLILSGTSRHSGQTVINQGTLTLGADHSIALQNYMVVGTGGTLNLNGNTQLVTDLFTDGSVAGAGGTVTGGAGSQIVLNRDASSRNWAGNISGAVNFARAGASGNTLTLYSNNDSTGSFLFMAGTTSLRDDARLSGAASIAVHGGTFNLNNNGLADLANRVNDAAPITLRGGALTFTGRVQTASREEFGALTLGRGLSELNLSAGGTGINSSEMSFASLASVNDGATNFQSAAGALGNGSRIYFGNGASLMSNNILPVWIVKGGNTWASYNAQGVGGLGDAGYAGYDGTALPAAGAGTTHNINLGASAAVATGGQTINTLNMTGAQNITFAAATNVLNLAAGGLMKTGANASFGGSADSGRLTAGGTASTGTVALHIHNQTGGWTMNSRIVDNPNGAAVRLVYNTYNGGNMTVNGANSYTGGTVIQGWGGGTAGTFTLGATGTIPAGGITIANANFTQVAGGVINPANVMTITGASSGTAGTITLVGANTLAGIVFENHGGTVNPTIATGGTLTLNGGISATSTNPGSTPTINGTVSFGGAQRVIDVAPIAWNGDTIAPYIPTMVIGAAMQNGGFDKTGTGILGIAGSSTFSGATNINAGSIQFTASGGLTGSTVNVTPSGTLNLGGFNPTIGGLTGTGPVVNTANGVAVATVNTLSVGASGANSTFDGTLSGAIGLTKVGNGTLTLTNASNAHTGGTAINGGTLLLGGGAGVNVTGTGAFQVNFGGTVSGTGLVSQGITFNPGSAATLGLAGTAPITTGASTLGVTGPVSLNVTGTPVVGTYSLIDYGGTALTTSQFAGFKMGTNPGGGFVYGLVNNTVNGTVDVTVETVGTANTWTGTASGTWTVGDAGNWTTTYADGQQVTFNDAAANKAISGGAVSPQAITVANSAGNNYAITNAIGGTLAGGLTKTGTGTLQLTGANTFSGPINVSGGTMRASVTSAANGLGGGSITLGNGTTLELDPVASTANQGLTARIINGAGGITGNRDYTATAAFIGTMFSTGTVDAPDNVGWVGGPADNYGAQFTGKILVPTTGMYTFFAASDDGSRAFVDGALIASSDGGHGVIEGGGAVFLTAGLHDLRLEQTEGSGGNDMQFRWQGPGITKALVPATSIFTSENGTLAAANNHIAAGNNLSVSGSTTIALNGTQFTGVQMGGMNSAAGSTLNVTGGAGKLLRVNSASLAGSLTLNQSADVALGQLSDNGVAVTLTKQGAGRLILDNTATGGAASSMLAGSVIDVQAGKLMISGSGNAGATNPIGSAAINLNGGSLLLDAKSGNSFTLNNAITATQANTLIESQATSVTVTLGGGSNGITLPTNGTLTIDAFGGGRSTTAISGTLVAGGATVAVAGPISGSGAKLTLRSTQFNGGQVPISGNLTLSGVNTYTGATTLLGEFSHSPGYHLNATQSFSPAPMTLALSGSGTLLATSGITFRNARLHLDNNTTNVGNRIADSLPINLNSSVLHFQGSTGGASGETVGTITVNSGFNIVGMNGTNSGAATTLTGNSFARANRAQVAFQGTTLGGATTNANLIKFTTNPGGFVGGGGVIGGTAKNVSILPYAVASANGYTAAVPIWVPVGLDATNGMRPLSTTNEVSTLATAVAGDNARSSLSGAASATSPVAVNSYVLDNSANGVAQTLTINSGPLTINSGALIFSHSNTSGAGALTLAAGTGAPQLVFPTGIEGVVHSMNTAGSTISMVISGDAGLTVGGPGQLTLNADNSASLSGEITVNGRLSIGADNRLGNPNNLLRMGGGTLNFSAATTVASTRAVSLVENTISGFDTATGNSVIAGAVTGAGGLAKTSGNTLTLSNPSYSGETFIFGGTLVTNSTPQGNIRNNGVLNFTQATDGTYGGEITGIGSVVKAGAGAVTLWGDHTYSGNTDVSGGKLIVNGTISGSVNVASGATLGGSGDILGLLAVNSGATLAPGNSPGILSAGNTSFNSGTFALEIFGDTPGNGPSNYDQLNVTGTLSLSGNIALTIDLGGFNPLDDGSMSFVVINNDSTDLYSGTGLFSYLGSPLNEGSQFTVAGQDFSISYIGGADNNDVVLTAVPEPGTAATLLAGLGSLMALKRRRRRA